MHHYVVTAQQKLTCKVYLPKKCLLKIIIITFNKPLGIPPYRISFFM